MSVKQNKTRKQKKQLSRGFLGRQEASVHTSHEKKTKKTSCRVFNSARYGFGKLGAVHVGRNLLHAVVSSL